MKQLKIQLLVTSGLVLLMLLSLAEAREISYPQLILKNIKQISAQEKVGEIYLLISDVKAKKDAFYTIPGHRPYFSHNKLPHSSVTDMSPRAYWKGGQISDVHDVALWSRQLRNNEVAELVVSLIEVDVPPWNPDDHLGSIEFHLRNINNKIKVRLIPSKHTKLIKQKGIHSTKEYVVNIKNGKANYIISFKVINKMVY